MPDTTPSTREESLANIRENLLGKAITQVDYKALSEGEGDLVITFDDGQSLVVTGDNLNWGYREPMEES